MKFALFSGLTVFFVLFCSSDVFVQGKLQCKYGEYWFLICCFNSGGSIFGVCEQSSKLQNHLFAVPFAKCFYWRFLDNTISVLCFKGKYKPVEMSTEWITMVDSCTKKMKSQVQEELTAAMTYLAMVKV